MPASTLFSQTVSSSGSVGSELWIDAGLITLGRQEWWGYTNWTAPDKALTFELRGNIIGQSTAQVAVTTLYASASPKSGASITQDLYRKGRLTVRSVVGTGVEHWWIRVKAKTATTGAYLATVYYTDY